MNAAKVLEDLKRRFPNEPEYHQAVEEVLSTIEEEYNKHPEFDKVNLIERLRPTRRLILYLWQPICFHRRNMELIVRPCW